MIYTGHLGQHSSHVIKYFEVSVLYKKQLYINPGPDILGSITEYLWSC